MADPLILELIIVELIINTGIPFRAFFAGYRTFRVQFACQLDTFGEIQVPIHKIMFFNKILLLYINIKEKYIFYDIFSIETKSSVQAINQVNIPNIRNLSLQALRLMVLWN